MTLSPPGPHGGGRDYPGDRAADRGRADGGLKVGQQDGAASPAPVGESAPGFPPQRGPETPAGRASAAQLPGQRPEREPGPAPAEAEAAEQDPGTPVGAAGASAAAVATLGERERAVLDFERRRWKHAGAKEQAIRDAFDLSATRYYQILNTLLDDPAALAYAPALVGRLRRIRDARQRARR